MSRHEDEVCRLIQRRSDMGLAKYGVTMERDDLSEIEWLMHARDEAMDLAIYLTRLIHDKKNGLA
jgi:hypothetical protein